MIFSAFTICIRVARNKIIVIVVKFRFDEYIIYICCGGNTL